MRAVLQRVANASVAVGGAVVGEIGRGWLVLLGVGGGDGVGDGDYLAEKIANLRAFPDGVGKMNLSVLEVGGEVLVVSQFTLYGDCRKGRRPGFSDAAVPETAHELYLGVVAALKKAGVKKVATGQFQAHMEVALVNDGPVTFLLDSQKGF
jgi:D-tyrosyl-tRNA(Tyr) deacylase